MTLDHISFLLWSNKHQAWWRPDGRGYTDDIAQAGAYTKEQAVEAVVQSSYHQDRTQVTLMVAAPPGWMPPAYLNHATGPWKSGDCLQYPSHLGRVIANLRGALSGLEQLGWQLAHHARRFGEQPGLYDDRGGDPAETVADVEAALGLFAVGITEQADVLGRAHEAVNRLGIRN